MLFPSAYPNSMVFFNGILFLTIPVSLLPGRRVARDKGALSILTRLSLKSGLVVRADVSPGLAGLN